LEAGTTRRSVLAGAAVLSAAAVLPTSQAVATLHADGIHDDTEALQALFDGKRVRVARDGVTARNEGGLVRLIGGSFRQRRPIRVRSDTNLYCGHCSFQLVDGAALPNPILTIVD
jgi:hypothetical protein